MTQNEVDMIVDMMRNLWPDWEGTDDEARVWARVLSPFKYEPTKRAVQDCFADQGRNYRRPLPAPIRKKAWAYGAGGEIQHVGDSAPVRLYDLVKGEKRVGFFAARGDRLPPEDAYMRGADEARKEFDRLYGGEWMVIRAKQEKEERDGDVPTGKDAKDIAEARVLAGPDTPGKRWLQEIKRRKKDQQKKTTTWKQPPTKDLAGRCKVKQRQAQAAKDQLIANTKPVVTASAEDIPF
jgi:hypothetical protein